MGAPLAVDPNTTVAGLWLTVDLLRGSSSPAAQGLKVAILAPKNTTATGGTTITPNTEVRSVSSPDDMKAAGGSGCLGALAYKAAFGEDSLIQCDYIAPAESAGAAATGTFTFGSTPTSSRTARLKIQGRTIDVPWNTGETADDAKTKAINAINEKTDDLHVVASSGGVGIVTLTAKAKGPTGNDVQISALLIGGAGGTLVASGATLTGGTTEPDFTLALALIQPEEYDYILICCSSAEVENASTGNHVRLETHIDGNVSGLNAKLQQGIYASRATIAAAKTGAIGRNSLYLEHNLAENMQSLPCELAGWALGNRTRRRRLNPNPNRIGTVTKGVYGSLDPNADNPTPNEIQDAQTNGVTMYGYNAVKELVLLRPVTTHSKDDSGNPDRRCFDNNEVDAMFDTAKDLRTYLPQQYFQVKVTKDRAETDEDLPEGVVEERDIKGTIVQRIRDFWVKRGVQNGEKFEAAVAGGQLIVQVNALDPTQVDIFVPLEPFKVLAKFGLYVAKVG